MKRSIAVITALIFTLSQNGWCNCTVVGGVTTCASASTPGGIHPDASTVQAVSGSNSLPSNNTNDAALPQGAQNANHPSVSNQNLSNALAPSNAAASIAQSLVNHGFLPSGTTVTNDSGINNGTEQITFSNGLSATVTYQGNEGTMTLSDGSHGEMGLDSMDQTYYSDPNWDSSTHLQVVSWDRAPGATLGAVNQPSASNQNSPNAFSNAAASIAQSLVNHGFLPSGTTVTNDSGINNGTEQITFSNGLSATVTYQGNEGTMTLSDGSHGEMGLDNQDKTSYSDPSWDSSTHLQIASWDRAPGATLGTTAQASNPSNTTPSSSSVAAASLASSLVFHGYLPSGTTVTNDSGINNGTEQITFSDGLSATVNFQGNTGWMTLSDGTGGPIILSSQDQSSYSNPDWNSNTHLMVTQYYQAPNPSQGTTAQASTQSNTSSQSTSNTSTTSDTNGTTTGNTNSQNTNQETTTQTTSQPDSSNQNASNSSVAATSIAASLIRNGFLPSGATVAHDSIDNSGIETIAFSNGISGTVIYSGNDGSMTLSNGSGGTIGLGSQDRTSYSDPVWTSNTHLQVVSSSQAPDPLDNVTTQDNSQSNASNQNTSNNSAQVPAQNANQNANQNASNNSAQDPSQNANQPGASDQNAPNTSVGAASIATSLINHGFLPSGTTVTQDNINDNSGGERVTFSNGVSGVMYFSGITGMMTLSNGAGGTITLGATDFAQHPNANLSSNLHVQVASFTKAPDPIDYVDNNQSNTTGESSNDMLTSFTKTVPLANPSGSGLGQPVSFALVPQTKDPGTFGFGGLYKYADGTQQMVTLLDGGLHAVVQTTNKGWNYRPRRRLHNGCFGRVVRETGLDSDSTGC